jgi:small multidrug resistance pump
VHRHGSAGHQPAQGIRRLLEPLFGWASIACYSVCFWALSFVLAKIPVGVAYAIWSGLGIVGITVVGWLMFKQSLGWQQLTFIALIVAGAVGLNPHIACT